MTKIPIIAIIGRPNVGKSTLFNRIIGQKRAVVEDCAGVTRDRNYALCESYEFPFYLVDTGGFELNSSDELSKLVVEQAVLAVEEADIVIAVFDAQNGCQGADADVVDLLRRQNVPALFVANKCDGKEHEVLAAEFYSLGIDEISDISALHGRGVRTFVQKALKILPDYKSYAAEKSRQDRMLEEAKQELERANIDISVSPEDSHIELDQKSKLQPLVQIKEPEFAPVFLPEEEAISELEYDRQYRIAPISQYLEKEQGQEESDDEKENIELPAISLIRVAIIGRPNVGKSTLVNTLIGEQRVLATNVSGTTRDSIHCHLTRDGQDYLIIDTAGLRKKGRVGDRIEKYSTIRALNSLSECDVAVIVLDAVEGPLEQDGKILGLAHEQGKGIVLAVNKWDLVEKDYKTVKEFEKKVEEAFKFSPYASLLFVSALTGRRCSKIISTVRDVALEGNKRIPTNLLNKVLGSAVRRQKPSSYRGQPVKLYYATQIEQSPPRFVLFFDYPKAIHFSYLRYLKNVIRENFGFQGSDIKLVCKKR